MPYEVQKKGDQWCVHKKGGAEVKGACHASEEDANAQMKALYASETKKRRGAYVEWQDEKEILRGKITSVTDGRARMQVYTRVGNTYKPEEKTAEREIEELTLIKSLPTDGMMRQLMKLFTFASGEADIQRALALPKLHNLVNDMLDERGMWLNDLYIDDDGSMYAIAARYNLPNYWRYPVTISGVDVSLGDPQEVMMTFQPVTRANIMMFRDKAGKLRWLGIAAASTINRSGEIDSQDLFRSLTDTLNQDEEAFATVWHQGEKCRWGSVKYLATEGPLLYAGGFVDESKLGKGVARSTAKKPDYWGLSIGYRTNQSPDIEEINGKKVPVYRQGKLREISILPEEFAASYFTNVGIQRNETRMTAQIRDSLMEFLGEDVDPKELDTFIGKADNTERTIKDKGLVTRDVADPAKTAPAPVVTPPTPATAPGEAFQLTEAAVAAIGAQVATTQVETFDKLTRAINQLIEAQNATQETITRQSEIITAQDARLKTLEAPVQLEAQRAKDDAPGKIHLLDFRPSVVRREQDPEGTDLTLKRPVNPGHMLKGV